MLGFHHISVPFRKKQGHTRFAQLSPDVSRLPGQSLFSIRHTRSCMKVSSTKDRAVGTAIIIVDHGSKRQAANDMLLDVAQKIRSRTDVPIFEAHMELAKPTIEDAVNQCSNAGILHITMVPFFLSPGRHATTDIPELTANAVSKYKGMTFEIRPPIGTHPGIIDVVLDCARLL